MKDRWVYAVSLVILVGAVFATLRERPIQGPRVRQPAFPFSHQKHIAAGLTCTTCHTSAEQETYAGVPSANDCADCHDAVGANTPLLTTVQPQLRALAKQGESVPWQKVYRVPGYVRFSHQRHVGLGKLECSACHGDIGALTAPVSRQTLPIRMSRCLACHRTRHVTTDCLACHR